MSVAVGRGDRVSARQTVPPAWSTSLWAVLRSVVRVQRNAPIWWGGGLGAMCALMVAMWPSIADSIAEAVRSYPTALKEAFGIGELDSVEKYVDAEMLSLIVPLALGFFAVRCVTRALTGAEDRGYLDPLLSLPLSRRVLVAGSFVATAVVLVEILVVMWVLSWATGLVAGTGISAGTMAAGFANVWPMSVFFAGLAVLISGVAHGSGAVTAVASATLVAMYVIDLVGKLSDPLSPLRVVSAFRYYGSAVQNGLNPLHMLGLAAAGVLMAAVGAVLFDRRDIL